MQKTPLSKSPSVHRRGAITVGVAFLCLTISGATAHAQNSLPFSPGERLNYRVSVSKVAGVGHGSMWVEGPVDVRGISTWLLRFDFSAGFGPMKAVDRTSSWLDPERMAAQRYLKHEKHVLSRRDERVEIFPADRRWTAATGANGVSPTDTPLDELSFMYFIRTVPLEPDSTYRFNRHFDPTRSPTTLKVVRREVVTTPAGRFQTILVEMRVRDPQRYRGEGVIRINLSDDSMRIPVRIESAMPVIGTAVMALESYTDPHSRKLALVK
jgi:hypothetical protein